jgi:copper homeostasis protein
MIVLETIAFTLQACIDAQAAGSHRIELCDNPNEGGTTPSAGFIKIAREKLQIPLFPIIRPRGGNFFYSEEEINAIKHDILLCKEYGCDGVVIGALHYDGSVNKEATAKFTELAYPMSVTFHRAFDRVVNMEQALEDIIDCGCERILTSGMYPTAMEGLQNLKQLVQLANDRINIMPGSGVRANNIIDIIQQTGTTEIHSSARKANASALQNSNATINDSLTTIDADIEEIQRMLANLKTISE